MDFTRTWTRAAVGLKGLEGKEDPPELPELRELQDVQQIEGSAMSFSGHECVFVYRFCCSIYKLDIFMALAADAVFVCWTKKFWSGGRWSEMEQRLGVFHQHNELIRLCWLFIVIWMENGNNKSPPICNYLCQWVRLMFISLCQLAAPAPTRCLCLCFCPAICIQFDIR